MPNIVYHGTNHVAAHTDEKQPTEGRTQATHCSICRDWFKPVPVTSAEPDPAYLRAAQTALDCQDACNLSGVVKSLAGPVMDALWAEARRTGHGTDWINQHPIVTLMLNKLASLNRTQCLCSADQDKFSQAYDAITAMIEAEAKNRVRPVTH